MFGTDGIRARVGNGPLALENVLALARSVGRLLVEEPEVLGASRGKNGPRVLVGRDTRASGPMIERVLVAGLESRGVEVVEAGVVPTPAVAHLTATERFDLGVVVSASHNPYHDNGIKFFDGRGRKIPRPAEEAIERATPKPCHGVVERIRPARVDAEAGRRYFQAILSDPSLDVDLEGFRIVLDCANGAVGAIALPTAFYNLKVQATFLANEPDGFNINAGCGATSPEGMRADVLARGADMGFSFDGDGDRVILADEEGGLVDGDAMLAILALDLAARGKMKVPVVVGTVLSNFGLEKCLAEAGLELVRTPVGDRHVAEKMAETGALLGGEPSGHIVFGDRKGVLTGDGLYTALRVLAVVARTGSSLAQLASVCQPVPQCMLAVPVRDRTPFEEVAAIVKELKSARKALGKEGRVVLRHSGTEDVARVMVEGTDAARVEDLARRLAQVVDRELGAARRSTSVS